MQIIIFFLCLFLIACVLYGIASGVQIIQRSVAQLASSNDGKTPAEKSESVTQPTAEPIDVKEPVPELSLFQHKIVELRELFALYQQGAITQEEFQRLKHHLLATVESPPNRSLS